MRIEFAILVIGHDQGEDEEGQPTRDKGPGDDGQRLGGFSLALRLQTHVFLLLVDFGAVSTSMTPSDGRTRVSKRPFALTRRLHRRRFRLAADGDVGSRRRLWTRGRVFVVRRWRGFDAVADDDLVLVLANDAALIAVSLLAVDRKQRVRLEKKNHKDTATKHNYRTYVAVVARPFHDGRFELHAVVGVVLDEQHLCRHFVLLPRLRLRLLLLLMQLNLRLLRHSVSESLARRDKNAPIQNEDENERHPKCGHRRKYLIADVLAHLNNVRGN